jgi:hypothetical protein
MGRKGHKVPAKDTKSLCVHRASLRSLRPHNFKYRRQQMNFFVNFVTLAG